MSWTTPRQTTQARRKKVPGRSTSSPALHHAAGLYGHAGNVGASRRPKHRLGHTTPSSGVGSWHESNEPEPAPAAWSSEASAREECSRLRQDLADRRGEERQLHQRVEQLEGSLQQRTHQLEGFLKELQSAKEIGGVPANLFERLASAHGEAYARHQVQGQQRQEALRERLAETQHESQRMVDRIRLEGGRPRSRPSSAGPQRPSTSCGYPVAGGGGVRTPLPSSRSQSQENLILEYERSQQELRNQVEKLQQQLDDERQARIDQEITSRRLSELILAARGGGGASASGLLGSSSKKMFGSPEAETLRQLSSRTGQSHSPPPVPQQGRLASPERNVRSSSPEGMLGTQIDSQAGSPLRELLSSIKPNSAGASAHRRELEALRDEERANRAAARRRCRAVAAADAAAAVDVTLGDPGGEAFVEFGQASVSEKQDSVEYREVNDEEWHKLQVMAKAFQNLEAEHTKLQGLLKDQAEALRASELRASEAEVAAAEAQEFERVARKEAEAMEQRAWAMTEAANELALQADLRHAEALENELRVHRQLRNSEQKCEVLQSIAKRMATNTEIAVTTTT
eukprot:TRINITY_DN64689_c0_g1_i1.p1 TRINITY_DN64689_c0_g1~~TRINITY_DN64689_c0_g1_i1.p1  ORF type:complete len:582 (-),score=132.98 TRINITY_DN64689_c0_g1_i1:168-1883(-)